MNVSLLEAMRLARKGAGGTGDATAEASSPATSRGLRTRAGQKLFFQGDPADAVYLLLSGTVTLQTVPSEEDEGVLSLLCRAPAIVGDRDLLLGITAREMATCLDPCDLRVWDAEVFRAEWDRSASLRNWLARDLTHRYARTLELQRLQQRPLAFRLAALLRALNGAGGATIPATRSLAQMVGATEKSVLRSLGWLREQGVLEEGSLGPLSSEALEKLEGFEDLDTVTFFHELIPEPG